MDLIVKMNGNCFLCLEQVSLPSQSQQLKLLQHKEITVKVEVADDPNVDESKCSTPLQGSSPPKVYSLEYLSRYLRMDISKALNRQANPIKASLLSKLKLKAKDGEQVKTELCGECAPLMVEFSEEYRHLEMTQMRLDSLLGKIHEKIVTAEGVINKSLDVGEAIRKEAAIKCSKMLKAVQPRVKLGNYEDPKSPRLSRAIFIPELGRYKCRLCSKLCSRSNFHYHYSNVHLQRKFRCAKCPNEYRHKTHLQAHYKTAHIGLRFRCVDCSQNFTRKFALAAHSKTCSGVPKKGLIKRAIEITGNMTSSSAGPEVTSPPDMEVAPEAQSSFKDEDPDPNFDISGMVKVKMDDDVLDSPEDCDPLQMDTETEPDPLEVAQDEAEGEEYGLKVYQHPPPSISENALVSVPGLGGSKSKKPPWSINPENGHLICDLCSQEFASKTTFYYHHSSVHKGISHQCSMCSKTFRHQTHYLTHYKSAHIGVRFKCLGCLKSFTRRAALTGHQRKGACQGKGTATTTEAEAQAVKKLMSESK